MNISLKKRIGASFIGANLMVLTIGFTVFYFLNSLNKRIEEITNNSNQISLLTDEIRISAVQILKTQKQSHKSRIRRKPNSNTTCYTSNYSINSNAKFQ